MLDQIEGREDDAVAPAVELHELAGPERIGASTHGDVQTKSVLSSRTAQSLTELGSKSVLLEIGVGFENVAMLVHLALMKGHACAGTAVRASAAPSVLDARTMSANKTPMGRPG